MSDTSRDLRFTTATAGRDRPMQPAVVARSSRVHAPHVMTVLALVGLTVAVYDSYAIYNGEPLWCPPPIDGCNEVAASPYARIFDLPVGYYGVAYYLCMVALAAALACDPSNRGSSIGAVLYAGLGMTFSAYFLLLQINYIHAFCIYCLVSAVTTVLLTAIAVAHLAMTRLRTHGT